MDSTFFQRLVWREDRMLLGDLVFRLQHYKNDAWELGEECFVFYKIKPLVDQYAAFWATRPDFQPRNVFELGIYDGGSVAFWRELFGPQVQMYVAADLARRADSAYFRRYLAARGLERSVKTFWGTNQADRKRLRGIAGREFSGPLDLVIDDASHMYSPTKASFETLFPLLRPGGLYVIEDWAWAHWAEFHSPRHPWATKPPLTNLIVELVEAAGTSGELVASMAVYQGFVVVERGPLALPDPARFRLGQHIARRPAAPRLRRLLAKITGK
ncbi:MAG: hypothetical protein OHK0022_14290 [Roseiflexaceae bacterium]